MNSIVFIPLYYNPRESVEMICAYIWLNMNGASLQRNWETVIGKVLCIHAQILTLVT